MAISGVMRAGYVQIRVTDMGAAADHYENVLGLVRSGAGADGRLYLKGWDEHDHHSVILRKADAPGMDYMGFKVSDPEALHAFERRLCETGVATERVPAGADLGAGERVRFVIPTGHTIELYAAMEQVGNGLALENPEVSPDGLKGIHPTHFDHCLLYGDDVDGACKLFTEVLGFRLAERVVTPDGKMLIGAFLACNTKPHDVAFIRSEGKGKFHHAAFYVESWHDLQAAADLLTKKRVRLDIGPTRHGITRGGTIYFFDPSGNRNETFSGGYLYYPDRPTLSWTENELGRAIFYYDRRLNENFLGVTT
jgi:catechol 2,3-dioxygenase